jgi:microcompartment protein CcmL/EutN
MEFFSVTESLVAADLAVKASDVTLMDVRLGTGIAGKSFVILTGDTAAVEQGMAAGTVRAEEKGMLIGQVVIPNPDRALFESLY